MLFVVKDRLEVLNQNIDFERGVELLRRGLACPQFKEGPFYRSLNTSVPHCSCRRSITWIKGQPSLFQDMMTRWDTDCRLKCVRVSLDLSPGSVRQLSL